MEAVLSIGRRCRGRLLTLVSVLLLALLVSVPGLVEAQVSRQFSPRFSTNTTGDILIVGNTLMTCSASVANCTAAQGGAVFSNNDFSAVYVDVDGDSSTFNSSSATLQAIPSGATVLFAGLYWTADSPATTRNTVKFKTPNSAAYTSITAVPDGTKPACDEATTRDKGNDYQCFANVTQSVASAGGGVYWAANVQGTTGKTDQQAGWALVVVLQDPTKPLRNLTVFDGFSEIQNGKPAVTFGVSGFKTPDSGDVYTRIGVVSTEGDLGLVGDSMSLNNIPLSDVSPNPANNFFNSTISEFSTHVQTKNPNFQNQLGFDIDRLEFKNLLKNGDTSATFKLTTDGDSYVATVITFATDLFDPKVAATKSVFNVTRNSATGPVLPGDVLEYTVTTTNAGLAAANNIALSDGIPSSTTYVASSMLIDAVQKSDAQDADEAFFDTANTRVVFNLGTGATSTAGGQLAPGQSSTIKFRVQANADIEDGHVISNRAYVRFNTAVLAKEVTISSNEVTLAALNRADLSIVKTTPLTSLRVGATTSYTLTITNHGPLEATARVVDHLPENLTFGSATPSQGGACTVDGRLLTCPIGLLAVNDTATVQIVMTARDTGNAINTAIVDTLEPNRIDPCLTPDQQCPNVNISSVETFVTGDADLAITKAQSSSTLQVGDAMTYTLTVTNNGPGIATGVTVTDAVPTIRGALESASTSQGSCSGTTPLTCDLGPLNVGANATITLVVRTTSAGAMPNSAQVTAIEHDPNVDNNTATTGATVNPPPGPVDQPADLSVVKTGSSAIGTVGQPFTYQIVVANHGPGPATGVVLSESLPDGVSLVSATPSQGSCGATQQFSCQLGPLGSGATATVTVVVTLNRAGTFSNLAAVTANEPDPNPGNNVATESASATSNADVAVTKDQSSETLQVGQTLTYTLRVTNNGPGIATNVTLTDALPSAHATLVSASPTQGTCSGTTQLTCALGTLNVNASATVTLVVRATSPGPLSNATEVRATETDPNPENNTDTTGATVTPPPGPVVQPADLSVVKTGSSTSAIVGQQFTYQVVVTNNGPNGATGIVLSESLPDGVTLVSATPTQGSCGSTRQFTCQLGTLAAGARATVTIVVIPTRAGTFSNLASVTGNEPDPNPDNNVATESASAISDADLAVTKTQSSSALQVGERLTYTLRVTNNGPGTATNVVLVDALPSARATLESSSSSQGTCTGTTRVTCALGTLNAGASVTVTLVVRATAPGALANAAEVTAIERDPNPDNNSATTGAIVTAPPGPVAQPADLSVVKTGSSATGTVGQPFTYQIVVANSGPGAATGVVLSESVPDGVSLVSVTPSQGNCGATQQFSCQLGTLAQGAQATVTVVVTPTRVGTFSNLASATANEPDPNPANNVETASASANGDADLDIVKQATPDPVAPGDILRYRVAIRNDGPAEATGVLFEDRLPTGVTLVSVRSSQGTCTVTNVISCDIGKLANGAGARIGIDVRVDREGTLLNAARVTADQPDPNHGNNVAIELTEASAFDPSAVGDISVTKTASAASVQVGQTVTFTVNAINSSTTDATGVIVTDILPQGAQLVSVTPSQGTCTGTGIVECALGTLAGGSSATVTIVARATVVGPFDNVAQVLANEPDLNPDNNEATVSVTAGQGPTPPPAGSLSVTKTASTTAPNVGDTVTFTITVTNGTTNQVDNATLTDALPQGLLFVSASPSQGTCTGTATVSCSLGGIAAGQSANVSVVAGVTTGGSITNTVAVSAPGVPTAQATVTIVSVAASTVPVTIVPVEPAAPKPDNDDKDDERHDERQRHEASQRQDQEDEETQGNVVAVFCADDWPRTDPPEAEDDGQDPPYVVIVTVDGHQKIRLRGRDARRACTTIRVGDYLEANGEKQHEHLFDADGVKVRVPMP